MKQQIECVCEGQLDLTDLVDDEHIAGSMHADETIREQQRQAWYQQLIDKGKQRE
jgi:hypothetical protein